MEKRARGRMDRSECVDGRIEGGKHRGGKLKVGREGWEEKSCRKVMCTEVSGGSW